MTDLVVVVPSRGRPQAARELAEAFADTCTADTQLVFSLDDDDPTLDQYPEPRLVGPNRSMVEALNAAAVAYARGLLGLLDAPFAVGFLGDDHRPRTKGWDASYLEALRELGSGIVYGNDLLQRAELPTQCAMTTDIVTALGYMAPPALTHLYVDNVWLELGRRAECGRYLPDVVVEHCHPIAGKAAWDEGYERVNNAAMYRRDEQAFLNYFVCGLTGDVMKIRALRTVRA